MHVITRLMVSFITAFVVSSCSSADKQDYSEFGLDELKSAPERIKLGGKEYYTEAYLWRDLMPVIDPKDVTGLFVSIKVKTSSGSAPDSVWVRHLWVINKDSVWKSRPETVNTGQSNSIECISRNGPFWEAGIKVDVVVQIQFRNQKRLLQVKEQKINVVY